MSRLTTLQIIKDQFSLRTLLLLGALTQAGATLLLPGRLALAPPLLLAIYTLARTAVQTITFTSPLSSRSTTSIDSDLDTPILGRTSVAIPPRGQGREGVVAFHLCVRFSHPLGILAPGVRQIGAHFAACNARILDESKSKPSFGCLGVSSWRADAGGAHNALLAVYYFASVEGLNRFAHDAVHRRAWAWYRDELVRRSGCRHIGIYHEMFAAPPGRWEVIGVNMPPTLLGAASVRIPEDGDGQDGTDGGEWVSTLVDATSHPQLRSQYSRMGMPGDADKHREYYEY